MCLSIVIIFSKTIMNMEVIECRPGNFYTVGAYPHGGFKVCKGPKFLHSIFSLNCCACSVFDIVPLPMLC